MSSITGCQQNFLNSDQRITDYGPELAAEGVDFSEFFVPWCVMKVDEHDLNGLECLFRFVGVKTGV